MIVAGPLRGDVALGEAVRDAPVWAHAHSMGGGMSMPGMPDMDMPGMTSPWAAKTYAASIGLPLRDGLTPQPPELPGAIPMFLIVAAVAVEALFCMSRTRGLDARKVMLVAGGVTGLIVAATLPLQQALTDPTSSISPVEIVLITVLGIPFGVLAGFLGARFTVMLRALAPATEEAR